MNPHNLLALPQYFFLEKLLPETLASEKNPSLLVRRSSIPLELREGA